MPPMISTRHADTDLLAGVESPRGGDGPESISALISESLLGDGITIRHKPRTGYTNEVPAVSYTHLTLPTNREV